MARAFSAASNQYLENTGAVITAYPVTVMAWFRTNSLTSNQGIVALGRAGPNEYYDLSFRGAEAGDPVSLFVIGSGSLVSINVGSVSSGVWTFVCGRSNSSTDHKVWMNSTTNTSSTDAGTFPASPDLYRIARSRRNSSWYMDGNVAEVAIWNAGLTDAEIALLGLGYSPLLVRRQNLRSYLPLLRDNDRDRINTSFNMTAYNTPTVAAHPRIIYPAAPLWVPAPAAGGPTYTLTAAYGSFTQTGQAAGLKASRLLTAAQGSYTLSGQDAGTRASRLLTAETGYLTQTGQASGLVASRLLAAAQGSYTLSGQAAALLVSRLLTAEQGSFTLSGQAAGLLVSRLLTAEQGTFTLSGQDAGLLISRLLTAAYGTFTITGQAADLVYTPIGGPTYTLVADQGSYTLSGQAAAMTAARLLAAAQGSYTMTGQDAGLLVSRILGADVGTYTITGQDASLLAARLLTAAQGSYTITGVAVTLSYSGEVIGAVVELADAAAFLVVLTAAGAFVVELTDAAAQGVGLTDAVK